MIARLALPLALALALAADGWPAPVVNAGPAGVVSISMSQCVFSPVFSCGSTPSGAEDWLTLDFTALAGAASGPSMVGVATPSGQLPPGSGEYQRPAVSATVNVAGQPVPAPGPSALALPALALIGLVMRRRRVA